MPLIKLLRTSTFRLAVIYLALFVASVIALLGYVYWNTAGFLARQTDQAVQGELGDLVQQYGQGGPPLVVHTVIQRARDPRESLYLFLDPRGALLAGNLDHRPNIYPDAEGWLDFQYNRRTMDGVEQHAARARAVLLPGGYYLLVGRDVQERRAIENLITNSLFWAIVLTLAMGLLGGLFMSRNMLARVDAINRSSREIMQGDLTQRLPLGGAGDELDQLAANLNAMLDQIEALMVGMRQVTDNVAHDLKSPLNRLRNRLEVTLMQDPEKEEYRQALEKTISEADQLLNTFNALLMIARAEAGSLRDSMTWMNLNGVVSDVVELYEPLAEEQQVRLTFEAEGQARVRGNRELLAQALANLIDNALKHGRPASAGQGRIDVHLRPERGGALLSVGDNGGGIPEADRARVLGRFVRLEASRNTPGSGLGLSLAAAVTRLHGGDLSLSDNHPGLLATLRLPGIAR